MKLIALLVGLLVERLATQLFHMRRLRWLDRVIDFGFNQAGRASGVPAFVSVLLLALFLVSPVAVVIVLSGDAVFGFAYLVLAVFVLFFSLGPKDIGEQVDDYCAALESNDEEAVLHTAKALVERSVAKDPADRIAQVEAAVCVQANNRLFAVIFWFILLGPLGAWAYRVTDLIRRRAVFNAGRSEARDVPIADSEPDSEADAATEEATATRTEAPDHLAEIVRATTRLHGWLAWIPAHLTALGYALAGSFDSAISAWRSRPATMGEGSSEHNENLLARVGIAALALQAREGESLADRGIRGATAANALVFRLLGIWAFVIAAMTIYGASL